MNTIFLSPTLWDLTIDSNNNIAMASDPYSMVQDASSAIMTHLGEVYFNTLIGLPYFQQILGHELPIEFYRAKCISAALTVPGVSSAQVFFTSLTHRNLSGQVQIVTNSGTILATQFGLTQTQLLTADKSALNDPYTQIG